MDSQRKIPPISCRAQWVILMQSSWDRLIYQYVSVLICGSDPSIHHAINADERLLATDIAITGLTLWKLGGRSGQAGIPKTESALRRLRNVTVEAAVPPAICAVINMITYLTLENLVHNWFAVMTARFYVWSLMFTLNS
ncbi:hypothetical protein FRC05_005193 [Tulasnella sp. 425]|nr:hypothetical protein FRC05_005193 [Tulasnella sp. 425]